VQRILTEEDARLWTQWRIQLLDTSVDFGPLDAKGLPPVARRRMPFRRITVKGPTAFEIDIAAPNDPNNGPCPLSSDQTYIEAQKNCRPVVLPIEALDWKGNKVTFTIPLTWAALDSVESGADRYNDYGRGGRSSVDMGRQRAAVAPSKKDYTTLELTTVQFKVAVSRATSPAPTFFPYAYVLRGAIEAARHLTTTTDAPEASDVFFAYHDDYAPTPTPAMATAPPLAPEKDGNAPAQVVLGIVEYQSDNTNLVPAASGVPIAFGAGSGGRGGGIVKPNTSIKGLSMGLGPVAETSLGDTFNPEAYFGSVGKLFGFVALTDLIPANTALTKAPQFVTEALHAAERYYAEAKQLHDVLASMPASLQSAIDTQVASANIVLPKANQPITTGIAFLDSVATGIGTVIQNVANAPANWSDGPGGPADQLAALPKVLDAIDAALANEALPCSGLRQGARTQLTKLRSAAAVGIGAITTAVTSMQTGRDLIRDLKAKIEWRPSIPLDSGPANDAYHEIPSGLITLKQADPLYLSIQVDGKSTDPAGGATLFASLDHFYVNLPPHADQARVQLQFDRIFFSKAPNAKAEIDVNLKDIVFAHELSFIQDIRKLIPLDGFSDPPHIDVDEDGIHASFSLGLPNLSFGIFSFENLSLSAGLEVPFLGEMTFRFSFCDRDNPFTVTVACLGGGGYFMLEMASGAGGGAAFRRLEASIDVCAQISINLGVASGSVSITAGFRLTYDTTNGVFLTGFVDLRGALDVLGLINISIEAKLELTYSPSDNSMLGSCTLTVEIEIAFFSKSVDLHFEKRFGVNGDSVTADNGDGVNTARAMLPEFNQAQSVAPSFKDLMQPYLDDDQAPHDPWSEYLPAFA